MCTSFHEVSRELCDSVAAVAHRLCTSFVNLNALKGLTSSRLIALDKQPGVRPVAAIHTMWSLFKQPSCQAILMVDASNALTT